MSLSVEVFWSFRSPYSYLATPRLRALGLDYDVCLRIRPVLPIAVRIENFFATVNPLWPPYLLRDHRLTRLGCAAAERGHGMDFLFEVSRIIWDGTVEGWHEGDHLARAAARTGLDLAALAAETAAHARRYDGIIEANQRALNDAGHWGVPRMVFDGEPFFGQDRLDLLRWRLAQRGLQGRADQEPR